MNVYSFCYNSSFMWLDIFGREPVKTYGYDYGVGTSGWDHGVDTSGSASGLQGDLSHFKPEVVKLRHAASFMDDA